MLACSGAKVDDEVCRPHDGLVVLDDQHRVAQVAQALERSDQAVIVGGMQPYRRLVADIQHPHKARADLGRKPNALGFSAAQGRRGSRQGEVVQTDVEQEAQPRVYLFENLGCDSLLALGQDIVVAVLGIDRAGPVGK